MEREKKLVSLCLLILFVACVVLYLLLYQVRGKELINEIGQAASWNLEVDGFIDQTWNSLFWEIEGWDSLLSWVNNSNILATWIDANLSAEGVDQTASTGVLPTTQDTTLKVLSGTDHFFGVIDSLDVLGLDPEYILKDAKEDKYYAYFQQEPSSLKRTVQQLWGNIFSITTESDLIKNGLFGDRVDYINLPEYKGKLVIMFIKVKGELWLIQLPYAQYHQSKPYLKSLFN